MAPAHAPPPRQEHYMAGLMPLQESITPWKVGVQVSEVARGGAGRGAPVLILEEGSLWVWRRPQGLRNRSPKEELEAPCLGSVLGRVGARCLGVSCRWVLGGHGAGPEGLSRLLSQTPPQMRPFHQDDFLRGLQRAGPQLTCVPKGDWLGLYRWVGSGQRS